MWKSRKWIYAINVCVYEKTDKVNDSGGFASKNNAFVNNFTPCSHLDSHPPPPPHSGQTSGGPLLMKINSGGG